MTNKEAIKWVEYVANKSSMTFDDDSDETRLIREKAYANIEQALLMAIKALSAEAVEVVRCKDCLMTKERDEYTNNVWCCRHREYMDYMYYCDDGLREGGEE